MSLTALMHEEFLAYLRRQAVFLDAWEIRAKAEIRALAEHHRRALGQRARHARIAVYANADFMPAEGDRDYFPILQARKNLAMRRLLHIFQGAPR